MAPVLDSLSIVLPAFDEAARLPATLGRIFAWLDEQAMGADRVEVIVVDDGSGDDTVKLARAAAEIEPRLWVECLPRNMGKGAAVRRGVEVASRDWVLFSDADLSTPIEELLLLVRAADAGAEIVIGSRDTSGSRIERHQPWYREAMGRTFNRFVRVVAVPGFRDTQCGFKLFSASAARDCFGRQTIDGFAFDVEILWIAWRRGYRIAEVGIRWINDDRSTVDPIRDSARMLADLARIRWRQRGIGLRQTDAAGS